MVPTEPPTADQDDMEDIDLEDLDLEGVVVACERKEENSFPNQQIRLLQSALIKSRNKEKGVVTQKI